MQYWVFRKTSWLCADGQFCCICVWLMYSQKPKKAQHNTTRPQNCSPATTGKSPKLCSVRSGAPAFGHVVPASWPPDVIPLSHCWRERTINPVCELCALMTAGRMIGYEISEDSLRNLFSASIHVCVCCYTDSEMHLNILTVHMLS